ncbi:MAG: DUF1045 domain-containing protein [Pseudomonadota bacterium]
MRYAIYLSPTHGSALEQCAARWLGRSAFGGPVVPPEAPAAAIPTTPARYGFHATMRAPFRLAHGATEEALCAHFERFAAEHGEIAVELAVARLGPFFALTAPQDARLPHLHRLTLKAFEPFRAPLSEEERSRRKPHTLNARALELLDAWGYPHVLDNFQFHMTLSGPVAVADQPAVRSAATQFFQDVCASPQRLRFALFVERTAGGPFSVLSMQ